jgi:hypothetical protein
METLSQLLSSNGGLAASGTGIVVSAALVLRLLHSARADSASGPVAKGRRGQASEAPNLAAVIRLADYRR